jgi:hypothetical protein
VNILEYYDEEEEEDFDSVFSTFLTFFLTSTEEKITERDRMICHHSKQQQGLVFYVG